MKIVRIKKGSWGKIVAFFDLQTSEGLLCKGFKIIEGANGKFVAFPSQQDKDGEYFDTIHSDKAVRQSINQIALEAYENADGNRELVGTPSDDGDIPF